MVVVWVSFRVLDLVDRGFRLLFSIGRMNVFIGVDFMLLVFISSFLKV